MGLSEYTSAIDVYSFGLLCYAVYLEVPPWQNASVTELLSIKRKGTPPKMPESLLQNFSIAMYSKLILHCISKRPTSRPKFKEILQVINEIKISAKDDTTLQYTPLLDDELWKINKKTGKIQQQ